MRTPNCKYTISPTFNITLFHISENSYGMEAALPAFGLEVSNSRWSRIVVASQTLRVECHLCSKYHSTPPECWRSSLLSRFISRILKLQLPIHPLFNSQNRFISIIVVQPANRTHSGHISHTKFVPSILYASITTITLIITRSLLSCSTR